MQQFIPDKLEITGTGITYFEDQLGDTIPGRGVHKPIGYYQNRISDRLMQLGAGAIVFSPGTFPTSPERYGFLITFSLNGIPGRIEVAALPIHHETPNRKDRALAQALYNVGEWLQFEIYGTIFKPGSVPLVPYLVGAGGKTVTETLVETQMLPMLKG